MKKRLRKKKHCGEFADCGRRLIVTRNQKDCFDEFLDAFIRDAIEANGCFCGGGGKEDSLDMITELGCRSDDPEARFERIREWLAERSDVQGWRTSKEFDLWHEDYQTTEDLPESGGSPE
jgi:uncharacterized protein